MNGQEAVAIPSAVGENYEPQAKKQRSVEISDANGYMSIRPFMPSKSAELGRQCLNVHGGRGGGEKCKLHN